MMWLAGTVVALDLVRERQHLLDRARCPRPTAFAVPPVVLDRHRRAAAGPRCRPCVKTSASIWFASQPRPMMSTPAKFGVARIAGERAAQDVACPRPSCPCRSRSVRERDDAVDVRESPASASPLGSASATCFATVAEQFTRREDADVVARGDAAVGAHDALEGRRGLRDELASACTPRRTRSRARSRAPRGCARARARRPRSARVAKPMIWL